ncbi:competence protein ComEC [Marinospirillum celere]|uniref:Competence protein ComEC n=1 Tax=Marinospirillum celere TaxID=1122252 RepID=A0A1I1E818_9GAMM|nr:DNA internalization-related competence protein ComEC/Rec2 [Marinospirillum celere]SFB83234.1 competence protein ComEC [Marinospirillum celere]
MFSNHFYKDIPSCWFFAAGLVVGIQLALLLSSWPPSEALILALPLALSLLRRKHWTLLGLLSGYTWLLLFLAWRMELAPSWQDTQAGVLIKGDILATSTSAGGRGTIQMRVLTCQRETGEPCQLAAKAAAPIRLNWYSAEPLPRPGEQWQLEARIRPLRSLKNEQVPSFTGNQLARGLVGRGYVGRSADIQKLQDARGLPAWRTQLLESQQAADLHPQGQRFLLALALGEGQALNHQDWQTLQKTGTVHLWVISGLHLGMLAGLLLWLARRLEFPWTAALVLSLLVAWGYAHLAGWGVATQRAAIMLAMGALILSGWRQLSPWTVFSLALIAVLVLNPLLVLTRGFWLSFGAVALLMFSLRGLRQAPAWKNLIRVQWVITLGLTPLLLWQSAHFSIWAPLVNLVAVPLVGLLLLPLSFASLLVSLLGGSWLAEFTSWLFAGTHLALTWVANLPALQIQQPTYLWIGLLGLLPPGFPGRWLAPLGLFLAFLPLPTAFPSLEDETWQVRVLDVGQGTAVLVESQGEQLLYDTGRSFPSGWAPVVNAIEPWLTAQGLNKIVISHDDIDHSGGLLPLLQRWPVETIIMSRPLAPNKPTQAQGQLCYAGQQWQLGALEILALWPPRPVDRRVEDEDSCVLLVRGEEHSLLLTGDAGTPEEAFFSQALPSLLKGQTLTLLQTGHHGSQTSTGNPLLEATRPQWALHTSGWRNAYGHPHASVVQRLYQHQVRQRDTGHHGSLHIQLEPGQEPQVSSWRQQNQPLWNWISHKPN